MIQYKLLEILDKTTLQSVINIFGNSNIYKFTNTIIGINYDFQGLTYIDVLQKVVGLNVRQWTLTSNRFMKIIEYAIDNNLKLGSIEFLEFIDSHCIKTINDNIIKINFMKNSKDKENLKKNIIEDLKWIMLDECIDIKSIFLSFESNSYPFTVDVKFFNNGVIYIDDDFVPENINLFLKEFFQEV
ncbi:hypothetical protein [Paraclostridium sordellii]|uniref:hypothetical protein n=1 Tax=Paraclostridium sordellii TaxID=1505 RepID=UPI001F05D754|nr:hypothetical protein [Paeniclostridium sordellii]MCH1965963.1 hypothetical protein [Paeniclostridium sordellii]